MNLQYLISTLKSACAGAIISHRLNTLGPRAGFVLGYDANHDPHMLYVEDSANSKRPAHIVCGELLGVDVKGMTDSVASLNLSLDQATERLAFALLSSLSSILYGLKSDDARTPELAGVLADYSVAGILSAIASKNAPPQPSPAIAGQPERN